MKQHSKNYTNLVASVVSEIEDWRRTQCSEIEQRIHVQETIFGITRAALFVLSTDEYNDFVMFIHEKGFDH